MKVLILSLFVACVASEKITPGEINKAVNDLDKGLDKLNVTLTHEDKAKLKEGLQKIADFKIEDHPEMVKAVEKIKDKIPGAKEKVCELAKKADGKIATVSEKVGAGIEKGFTKLGNEKFPLGVSKFQTIIEESVAKGVPRETARRLIESSKKLQACMQRHLTAFAAPLGNIVESAGLKNQNVFKKLVEPYVEDINTCKETGAQQTR